METLDLNEIREALEAIEKYRAGKDLDARTIELLEEIACVLRRAERQRIEVLQQELTARARENDRHLKDLTQRIRSRVEAMNEPARDLNAFDRFLKTLLRTLEKCGPLFE